MLRDRVGRGYQVSVTASTKSICADTPQAPSSPESPDVSSSEPPDVSSPEPPLSATGGAGGGENAHGGGEGGSSTRQRWLAKNDTPRLAHVLVELKSDFLARDAKPTSRVQLDATPRNAFWQLAALKFNSASFIPTKIDAKWVQRPAVVRS